MTSNDRRRNGWTDHVSTRDVDIEERPIVVSSLGRSGSTLLQRVLCSHPEVTVWGEHLGFLKDLRSARDRLAASADQLSRGFDSRDALVGAFADVNISEHVNPFDLAGFEDQLRQTIVDLFASGLPPRTAWGFKEIRYDGDDLEFFATLFPGSRFVILAREPGEQISSALRAPWRQKLHPERNRAKLDAAIRSNYITWTRRHDSYRRFIESTSNLVVTLRYQDMVSASWSAQDFLGQLGITGGDREAAQREIKRKSNSSDSARWPADQRASLEEAISEGERPENFEEVRSYFLD